MCEPKEIDLSKAEVGDRVRSSINGQGTIKDTSYCREYPIVAEFNGIRFPFTLDGRRRIGDLYPEIVEWIPQKRKVKKVFEAEFSFEKAQCNGSCFSRLTVSKISPIYDDAMELLHGKSGHIRFEYEVEE